MQTGAAAQQDLGQKMEELFSKVDAWNLFFCLLSSSPVVESGPGSQSPWCIVSQSSPRKEEERKKVG